METYTLKETAVVERGDVLRVDVDGTAYLAMRERDAMGMVEGLGFDCCGRVVVSREEFPHQMPYGDWHMLPWSKSCHKFCNDTRRAYETLASAWNWAVEQSHEIEGPAHVTPLRMALLVCKRFGYDVAFIKHDYYDGDWRVVETRADIEIDFDALVFTTHAGAARMAAREECAMRNGYAWVVGTMDVEQAASLGEYASPTDCDFPVWGYVFANVDDDGESTPTVDELTTCL